VAPRNLTQEEWNTFFAGEQYRETRETAFQPMGNSPQAP
jgi:hypothetical protein